MWDRLRNVCAAVVALLALSLAPAGVSRRAYAKRHKITWSSLTSPAAGPARVIGGHGSACITGAVELPAQGAGFQAVDLSRRRHFGHPVLVDFVVGMGRAVRAG